MGDGTQVRGVAVQEEPPCRQVAACFLLLQRGQHLHDEVDAMVDEVRPAELENLAVREGEVEVHAASLVLHLVVERVPTTPGEQ